MVLTFLSLLGAAATGLPISQVSFRQTVDSEPACALGRAKLRPVHGPSHDTSPRMLTSEKHGGCKTGAVCRVSPDQSFSLPNPITCSVKSAFQHCSRSQKACF